VLDPCTKKQRTGSRWSSSQFGVRQLAAAFTIAIWRKFRYPYTPSPDFRYHLERE
jgi:hypothetical protein